LKDEEYIVAIFGGFALLVLSIMILQIEINIPILGEMTLLNAIVIAVLGIIGILFMAGLIQVKDKFGF